LQFFRSCFCCLKRNRESVTFLFSSLLDRVPHDSHLFSSHLNLCGTFWELCNSGISQGYIKYDYTGTQTVYLIYSLPWYGLISCLSRSRWTSLRDRWAQVNQHRLQCSCLRYIDSHLRGWWWQFRWTKIDVKLVLQSTNAETLAINKKYSEVSLCETHATSVSALIHGWSKPEEAFSKKVIPNPSCTGTAVLQSITAKIFQTPVRILSMN